jgi:prevent-host-death family protein
MATDERRKVEESQADRLTQENFCISKSVGAVRNNFAQVLDDVKFYKDKILITEHGRPSAVIMPLETAEAVKVLDKCGILDVVAAAEYPITTREQLIELLNRIEWEAKNDEPLDPGIERQHHRSPSS